MLNKKEAPLIKNQINFNKFKLQSFANKKVDYRKSI